MIVQNKKLLACLEDSDAPLGHIILFFIENDYNLYHFFNANARVVDAGTNSVIIRDELYGEVQRITSKLIEAGSILVDYPAGKSTRLTLAEPLYILEQDEEAEGINLEAFLAIFPEGNRSPKSILKEAFRKFQASNTATEEEILEATRAYVNWCLSQQRTLRDSHNFIYDANGYSFLEVWLENIKKTTKRNDII